jgi:hypothetical protein
MSLTRKRRVTEKRLAANRRNGARSRGPVTPRGQAHSAAANLRHGYYSKSAEVALAALGEDPAEFKRRLESLVATYQPANALEMGLVVQMLRAQWRMERFHRMAESLMVEHLEKTRKHKQIGEAILLAPLFEKYERLNELAGAVCPASETPIGPEAMQVFEKCRGDLPAEKAMQVLQLLLRLRKPGAEGDFGPSAKMLEEHGEVPAAEGEERIAASRDLMGLLAGEIEPLEKRIRGEDPEEARAQIERDQMLAGAQPKAALLNRGEESSLRQLWRTTNLLLKIQKNAKTQRDVKNVG